MGTRFIAVFNQIPNLRSPEWAAENRWLLVAILSLFLVGCSDVAFMDKRAPASVTPEDTFGTDDPVGDPKCETENPVEQKFLFIVDQSGSNATVAGTDVGNDAEPGKPKRVGSIMNFFSTYSGVDEFSWNLITFRRSGWDDVIKSRVVDANGDPIFTNNPTKFENGVMDFKEENDGGKTPYRAAVEMAKDLMEAEIEADNGANIIYNIFFLSDGFPTDDSSDGSAQPLKPDSPTLDIVEDIANLKEGHVFFHTAYYAAAINDPMRLAADGLYAMAMAGNGYFIDIPSDLPVDFETIRVDCED